jgi:hypothetical protein
MFNTETTCSPKREGFNAPADTVTMLLLLLLLLLLPPPPPLPVTCIPW